MARSEEAPRSAGAVISSALLSVALGTRRPYQAGRPPADDGKGWISFASASREALAAVDAAAAQNRLWNLAERLYASQGPENSGWVTEPLLRSAAADVPGLDADRMLGEATSAGVRAAMVDAARHADAA